MADMMALLQQAQDMQAKMQKLQEKMNRLEVEGKAGGGLVRVVLSVKGQMKNITIDPSLYGIGDKKEMLEDLIVAAHEDARRKGEELLAEEMKAATGGFSLPPEFNLPLSKG